MASTSHEIPNRLFRDRPEALVHLIETVFALRLPRYRRIQIDETDFTQLVPTEYRADLVLTLEGRSGPVGGLVVEAQLSRKKAKHYSWPLYTAALHAKVRCPTWLVVLAGSNAVARWARRAIPTYQPGTGFAPLVIAPSEIPQITSESEATRWPELAVLAARAHGNSPHDGKDVVAAAVTALIELAVTEPERANLYYDMVLHALGRAARTLLENEMETRGYQYKSDFARRYFDQGRLEEARLAVRRVLGRRELTLSPALEERIASETDLDRLERWHEAAVTAASAEDVFALD